METTANPELASPATASIDRGAPGALAAAGDGPHATPSPAHTAESGEAAGAAGQCTRLPGEAFAADDLPPDSPWWARWMVANWREAWRWASVQWPFFCALGCEVYAQYSDKILALVPEAWRPHLVAAVFIIGAIVRLKSQTPKEKP